MHHVELDFFFCSILQITCILAYKEKSNLVKVGSQFKHVNKQLNHFPGHEVISGHYAYYFKVKSGVRS